MIDRQMLEPVDYHLSNELSNVHTLHPALINGVDGPMPNRKQSNSSTHSFHTTQRADEDVFTMFQMTGDAPWSARIQPAILQMFQPVTYKHWFTKVTASQKSEWLILFEGSIARNVSNAYVNENDVWASGDDGATWELIAGTSRFGKSGLVTAASPQSFTARAGATNCEDPSSDYVFSLGGYTKTANSGIVTSNTVFVSSTGLDWYSYISPNLTPRYFSSCDVDMSGHLYTMGGITVDRTTGAETMLNDVWSNYQSGIYPQTLKAPWRARAEHLTLITSNEKLGREIIYVMGGMLNPESTLNSNDVWASSDAGVTWKQIAEKASWGPRWGHGGVITSAGVIVVWGGSNTDNGKYTGMYTYRDVHASFDGGKSWHDCRVPAGEDDQRSFLRTEQGATLTTTGELIIASGYSFCPVGECEYDRYDYRDVWKTSWSLDDTAKLARMCRTTVPKAGVGLQSWPGASNPNSKFLMKAVTYAAPWSQRIQPALLTMANPITYTQSGTGLTVSTPSNWLLMYEGALTFWYEGRPVAENDVWASGDDGKTWDLVAGMSFFGTHGFATSSHINTSFVGRAASTSCEDPSNDDVYSISGTLPNGVTDVATDHVWYSSDAQNWVQTRGSTFSPARFYSSCDVTDKGTVILIGGVAQRKNSLSNTYLLNDVWWGTGKGQNWKYVGEAPFAPRAEHLVLHTRSTKLRRDLIYVIGGYSKYDQAKDNYQTDKAQDVWVSSDLGVEWTMINEASMFSRWGHAGVITQAGVIAVIGGASAKGKKADSLTLRDVMVSLDGGLYFSQCNMPASVEYIRTEQGAQVTEDSRLILASGYSLAAKGQMRQYRDVFITDFSLDDFENLAVICEDVEIPENDHAGLQSWPSDDDDDVDVIKKSGLATSAIILAVIAVLALLGYCGYQFKHTGRLPLPWRSETSYNELEAPVADFSAFSFDNNQPTSSSSQQQ